MKLRKVPLDQINAIRANTLLENLEIEVVEIGDDYLVAKMPVGPKVHQPMGLLHGGATAALIESIGSFGSALLIDQETEAPVGLELNVNHLKSVKSGQVEARGKVIHAGRRSHVWQVDVFDSQSDKMISTGRLTVMIVPKNHG